MFPIELSLPAFIIAVVFLWKGSDMLVDGTAKTATRLGISTLIISVILVGFGTSTPELAVSVGAAVQNEADISVGNIIGSNIANLLLVLGVSALIRPIPIDKGICKREWPVVLLVTMILLGATVLGLLDQYHIIGGVVFLILFGVFLLYFIRCARKERSKEKRYTDGKLHRNLAFIILGIIGVVAGAWLLIESAICIATFLGIPTILIALSMVAVGTSLPELVVSVVASFKGESEIAVGNVLGSNVFNILMVLGVSALFIPLNSMFSFDLMVILVVVTLLMFPFLYTGRVVSRIEGGVFLILYGLFLTYIFWLQDVIYQTL